MQDARAVTALGSSERRVLVFIPSLNDAAALPELVGEINAMGTRYQPLVIDDGSQDLVVTRALMGQCLHARLPANFGLGVCTHVAFGHALRHGYGAVVRVDGDGQHRTADIAALMKPIDSGEADLVAGVRVNQSQGGGHFTRRMVKSYFNAFARRITRGCAPDDVNTGFFAANGFAVECLSRDVLERFPEPEMYVTACRAGLRVRSVPVEQRQRVEGRSTIKVVGGIRMFFRFNVLAFGELFRRRRP